MIEKAKQAYPSLDFEVMNALELPYLRQWDLVFSNAVFHWILDHDLLIQKIKYSLKPSGRLICEFGTYGNIQTIENGFKDALEKMGLTFSLNFNFPTVDAFGSLLEKHAFYIDKIYDYDRPTPLMDGENGLYNWAKQFFERDLDKLSENERNLVLKDMTDEVREELWNDSYWTADYRRLRVIAYV